jgi:hypothetical protein
VTENVSERRREILDGQRSWDFTKYANDPEFFYTMVVLPLRELKSAGMFDELDEMTRNARGRTDIVRVDIVGAINLEA